MIYLIGGAPRTGKSILGQRFATKHKLSWISTDILMELLRLAGVEGVKAEWDASLEAIESNAAWFFPYLERLVWGLSSQTDGYVVEGADFLPAQASQLSLDHPVRAVFLGRSQMTLAEFDRYPGRSPGCGELPRTIRQQMLHDIPQWSTYVQELARRFEYPYVDVGVDFSSRLDEAEAA